MIKGKIELIQPLLPNIPSAWLGDVGESTFFYESQQQKGACYRAALPDYHPSIHTSAVLGYRSSCEGLSSRGTSLAGLAPFCAANCRRLHLMTQSAYSLAQSILPCDQPASVSLRPNVRSRFVTDSNCYLTNL